MEGEAVVLGWEWAILAIPFVIGIASGGQNIYAKLGGEWLQVLRTVPGWSYWFSRGVVPAISYYALFLTKLGSKHSISAALLCGLGSEAVLRSRFFIGSKNANGKTEEVYKGVFDLVEWYQNLCLRMASDNLAAGRVDFIKAIVGTITDFPELCAKASANTAGFQVSGAELQAIIDKKSSAFHKEPTVKSGSPSAELHRTYAYELAYALLHVAGRKHLKTLLS